jgi:hypothetical protein
MKKTVRVITFFILCIALSCDDQSFFIQCSDCVPDEPITAELNAELDPDHFYGALIEIWEGNIEDSIQYGSYTALNRSFTQSVTLNKKYSITATYYVSEDIYIAVDSATPRVKYDKSSCEEPCYYIYDTKLNLKLKYTH